MTYVVSDVTMFVLNNLPHQFICAASATVSLIMAVDFLNTTRKQIDVDKLRSTFSENDIDNKEEPEYSGDEEKND